MSWKFWEKSEPQAATLKEPEWWRQTANVPVSDSGVTVNKSTAMQLSAFFACVRILAESIGSLPLKVYRRMPDGGKEIASNHPLNKVFGQVANDEMTPQELLEFIMASCQLTGTAFCEKEIDGAGRITALHPLDPAFMRITRDSKNKLVYDYQDPNQNKVYTARKIWRVPGLGGDGVTGYSTLAYARQTLGTSLATERHAAKTFANGTRIGGVFQMDGHLDDDSYERLKNDLVMYTGVDNANKTMILEHGLEYKGVAMKNDEAQFLESRKFNIADVARWFRVPLHMLNELDRATFSNIEHQSIEFVMHTLRPWCKRIEHTITRDLIAPQHRGKFFAEFTLDALLRGDTQSRYEAYGKGIQDGWLNRNEVRKKENLNPVEGLDEYLTPMNMQPSTANEPEPEEEATSAAEALKIINQKEVAAIRAEHGRSDFDDWLTDFYKRMNAKLVEQGVDGETAGQWAESRRNDVAEATDVLALMDEWENL